MSKAYVEAVARGSVRRALTVRELMAVLAARPDLGDCPVFVEAWEPYDGGAFSFPLRHLGVDHGVVTVSCCGLAPPAERELLAVADA